jgi:mono/diheme cytochrome c family protein
MRKTMTFTLIGLWALATALSQPAGAPGKAISVPADARTLAILSRSCQNCHSANTKWPLYGKVFPMSALLQHDVRTARSHMDLSGWPLYENSEKRRILSEVGEVVRSGIMPPKRYILLHQEAKLTPEEADHIYEWTRSSRSLLKTEEAQENSLGGRE